jgi:hypothetical protein
MKKSTAPKPLSAFMEHVRDNWIGPLLTDRPKGMRATEWLHFLFCLDSRALCMARVKRDFTIVADRMDMGVHADKGVPEYERRIYTKTLFCVRKDITTAFYDLEDGSNIWRVSDAEWQRISRFLELPAGWPNHTGRGDNGGAGVGKV